MGVEFELKYRATADQLAALAEEYTFDIPCFLKSSIVTDVSSITS